MIQQNFIDMEKMLELFKEQQSVQDIPGAEELKVTEGSVIFGNVYYPSKKSYQSMHIYFSQYFSLIVKLENVGFSYDPRHPALKNISFEIPKGKTVALVGPSGGG